MNSHEFCGEKQHATLDKDNCPSWHDYADIGIWMQQDKGHRHGERRHEVDRTSGRNHVATAAAIICVFAEVEMAEYGVAR